MMLMKYMVPIALTVILITATKLHGWVAILTYGTVYVIMYLAMTYLFVANGYEKHLIDVFLKKVRLKRSKH